MIIINMQNKDILKLLIYARGITLRDNENIPSRVHLQKEMFLLLKETIFSKEVGYKFIPYYYGPFSRDLDTDLIELTVSGKINDLDGYNLTPDGFKEATLIWNNLDETKKKALSKIKERYNRMNSSDLLNYVYVKYKKYTIKSVIILDNIYNYFNKFASENDITIKDLDIAFNRIRHPINENRN